MADKPSRYRISAEDVKDSRRLLRVLQDMQAHSDNLRDRMNSAIKVSATGTSLTDVPEGGESTTASGLPTLPKAPPPPVSTVIFTTAPLRIDGAGYADLSTDRTLTISNFTGDSGAGGAKGAVPAPAAGDAALNKYLRSSGGWQAISASEVTGLAHNLLSATHTDTLVGAAVRGSLIAGNSTPKWSALAIGTTGKFLRSDGADPSWQTITASDIPATVVYTDDARLSDARTPLAHAPSHKSGGSDVIKLDELGATTDVTTLNASITAHGLLPKLSNVAGEYLSGTGAWSVPATAFSHDILSATHSDSLAGVVVRGSLIVGNLTPKWSALGIGAAGTILSSNGTDASWSSTVPATLILPVVDTQTLVKGSGDPTKLWRVEVDGFTTGTTRVATVPDSNFTFAGLEIDQDFLGYNTFAKQTYMVGDATTITASLEVDVAGGANVDAILGTGSSGYGVHGVSTSGTAVAGESTSGLGIHGRSRSSTSGFFQSSDGIANTAPTIVSKLFTGQDPGIKLISLQTSVGGVVTSFDGAGNGLMIGTLTANLFVGALTGNVTGNATGTATGLDATVTAGYLQVNGPTVARLMTVPDAAFTVARTDAGNVFTGNQLILGSVGVGSSAGNGVTNDWSRFRGVGVSSGASVFGSYGGWILNANTNFSSSARRYLITNAYGANKFAIIRSVDASTDPALGDAGVISSGTADFVLDNTGRVGIGVTPASRLHLPAGSATAGTAPLMFTSGALTTAAVAGQIEFLTDAYYGTITTGAARKQFAFTALTGPINLKNYTVATLPAGTQGDIAYCTDLLAPAFLVAAVGGGAVVGPVFRNATTWVSF